MYVIWLNTGFLCSNNHSGNTPVSGSVHWNQITGLVPAPTSANEGQGLLVDASGDFTLTEVPGRNNVHVLLTSSYTSDNHRIQADISSDETEVAGDIHTFVAPSAIGTDVSGTAVSLFLGGSNAAHTIVNPDGTDVFPGELTAGTRYWVHAIGTDYILIEEPRAAGNFVWAR